MAIFRHQVVLSGCSRDWFQQFVVEVHNEVEALRFEGGRLAWQPSDGQGDPEVVLVAGQHARKGAEYRIGPEAEGLGLTITAWDKARGTGIQLLSREDGEVVDMSVNLRSANQPEIIEILGDYSNPQGSRLGRRASWRANISLTQWWEYLLTGKGPAPVVARATHPLAEGKLEMFPRPAQGTASETAWAVDVVGRVRGRSWARPLAAVGLLMLHRIIWTGYRKGLDDIAGNADAAIARLPDGSPRTAAKAAVGSLLAPKDRVVP
jgi:hypothetical protein